jgi:phosphoribulokinase
MSQKHPVIVVTGSSGSGTTTVKSAFEHIFLRNRIEAAYVSGDSFHLHNRQEFQQAVRDAEKKGNNHFSHFGPESNDFKGLENLFKSYGKSGSGQYRHYIHSKKDARRYSKIFDEKLEDGAFTPYEALPGETDLLLYEGLHGMVRGDGYDVTRHVDLALGVVPVVNIEWIQKIHRDRLERGYSQEEIIDTILRRMPDYVNHITPQFSLTDINFQRVATVDTSNPFIARDIPTLDESFVVIRFRNPNKFGPDFTDLLSMLQGSFMSRRNTMVVPGGKMGMAMEVIVGPIIENLLKKRSG